MPFQEPITPHIMRVAHPIVHLREYPDNGSERVSQTLLGHPVIVHKVQKGWAWVETDDSYRGWADTRWLRPDESRYRLDSETVTATFADVRVAPEDDALLLTRLSQLAIICCSSASTMPGWVSVCIPRTDAPGEMTGYVHSSALTPLAKVEPQDIPAQAVRFAEECRGTPYIWGGSSTFGLDCSGLVQFCHRLAGITLRRDADIQREDPRFDPVVQNPLQPGDLLFFGKPDHITHVGMHRGGGEFIHSAGGAGVITSKWDDDRYSPAFVDARRLAPSRAEQPVTHCESKTP